VNRLLSGGAIDTSFNGGQPQKFVPVFPSDTASLAASLLHRTCRATIDRRRRQDRPWDNGYYFAMAASWKPARSIRPGATVANPMVTCRRKPAS
jgi:hypothetical protein